jgi:hypothetical protein
MAGTAVAKSVNKLFCCKLDAQLAKLLGREAGSGPLWAGCAIPGGTSDSDQLALLRSSQHFTTFLDWRRWRRWTKDCGPDVSAPPLACACLPLLPVTLSCGLCR